MKLLLTVFFFLAISMVTFAGNSALFSYDANELNDEFAELQIMETMIAADLDLTLADFEQMDADWLSYVDLGAMKTISPIQAMFGFDDFELVAFAWGLCCCPVGIFTIVMNDNKSKDEKTSFWFGVIGGTLIGYYPALVIVPLEIIFAFASTPY